MKLRIETPDNLVDEYIFGLQDKGHTDCPAASCQGSVVTAERCLLKAPNVMVCIPYDGTCLAGCKCCFRSWLQGDPNYVTGGWPDLGMSPTGAGSAHLRDAKMLECC